MIVGATARSRQFDVDFKPSTGPAPFRYELNVIAIRIPLPLPLGVLLLEVTPPSRPLRPLLAIGGSLKRLNEIHGNLDRDHEVARPGAGGTAYARLMARIERHCPFCQAYDSVYAVKR